MMFAFSSTIFKIAFLVGAEGESKYQLAFRSDTGTRLEVRQVTQLSVTCYVPSPYVTSLESTMYTFCYSEQMN